MCKRSKTGKQILGDTQGKENVFKVVVYKWAKRFNEGRENLQDNERLGRPSVIDCKAIEEVRQLILHDRRITYSQLRLQSVLSA